MFGLVAKVYGLLDEGKSQQLLIEVDLCSGGVFGVLGKRF